MGPRRDRRNDPVTEITGLHFASYVLVCVFTFSTLQGRNSLQQALNLLLLISNVIPEFLVLSERDTALSQDLWLMSLPVGNGLMQRPQMATLRGVVVVALLRQALHRHGRPAEADVHAQRLEAVERARNSTDPYPVLENSSAKALIKCVLPQEGQVIGGVTRWLKAEGFSMVLANVLVTQSLLATFSPLILTYC